MELQTRLATPKAGLSGIKVSLISATFKYRRSYQENLWAESLADLGATVSIFAPIMKNSKTQTRDKPTPITQYKECLLRIKLPATPTIKPTNSEFSFSLTNIT